MFKRSIILTAIILFTFSVVTAQKRSNSKKTSTTAVKTSNKTTNAEETSDLNANIPPAKSQLMSEAYRQGVLPAFAALPEGTIEEQAMILAEAVSAGDENSTAALLTAYRTAGYGIRRKNGDVDYENGWQGIVFDEWELAAVAKLYGENYAVGLGRFADSLSLIEEDWKKESNAADLIEDIRTALTSKNPRQRFWAFFIVELGRRAEIPYNLMDENQSKYAKLDAV